MRTFSAAFVALAISLAAQLGAAAPLRPNPNGISANLWPGVNAMGHPAEAPSSRVFRRDPALDPLSAYAEQKRAPQEEQQAGDDVQARAFRCLGGGCFKGGASSSRARPANPPPAAPPREPRPADDGNIYHEAEHGPIGDDGYPINWTARLPARPGYGDVPSVPGRRPQRQPQRQQTATPPPQRQQQQQQQQPTWTPPPHTEGFDTNTNPLFDNYNPGPR